MKRKVLSTIIALLLVAALLPMSVLAASYTDTDGHWAESSIERWSKAGIVQGSGDAFAPDSDLTCAQLATILAKLLRLPAADDAGFSDNLADAWYYDAINRCAAADILTGYADGTVRPNESISRARAMVMLARALGIETAGTSVLNGYADAASVPDWARGYVAALLRADIVAGVSGSRLAPNANITRAQFVTILDRAIAIYADEDGATVKANDVDGLIVVVAEDVTVKDAPAGTKVVATAKAKGLKVNGKSVDANNIHVVPETVERPKSAGHAHTHEYKYTDNGDGTHTGVCTANDSTLEPAEHVFDENRKCTICGAVISESSVASVRNADGTVTYYKTLADAVTAASETGATVTLVDDITADITVSSGEVTIALNRKTLRNQAGNTITVNHGAKLTVTGEGTVDNVTHGKAAVYNMGTVILAGGTFERSQEAGTSASSSGGNSFYTVLNHGSMTVQDGVVVKNEGKFSSLFENGYYDYNDCDGAESPELTILGGTFDGGLNTVKNDDNATITVKGGTFQNYTQAAFQNHHIATIEGGSFCGNEGAASVIQCGVCKSVDETHDKHELTISDGTFTGDFRILIGTATLTGGTYSSDPSAYVAAGYKATEKDGVWTVEEMTWDEYPTDASVVPAGLVITEYPNGEFDAAGGHSGTITIKDKEALLYFAYRLDLTAAYNACRADHTHWDHTCIWYGSAFARHIVLDADIDLENITLENGFGNMKDFTFDAQGHTIKNVTINYEGTGNSGLFVGGNQGISNLIVENVHVNVLNSTEGAAGIVSSDANANFSNVTVRNSSVTGGKYTGAVVGYNYGSVTNCAVENCTVSGRYKVGGIVGYICGGETDDYKHVTDNTLTGVTVKGEKLIEGKSDFVIGRVVGNWNAPTGKLSGNTFSGTTDAVSDIGEIESRCTVDGIPQ